MKSIYFEGCNNTFGPPQGMSNEECFTVHSMIEGDRVITAWLPSKEDLANLRSGKPIFLSCYGGMPPVNLMTVNDDGTSGKEDEFLGDEETKWINNERYLRNASIAGIYAREFRTEKEFFDALRKEID
jgi:hypothetical protein